MTPVPTPLRLPEPTERVPPYNSEAEQHLLGALLIDNRVLDRVPWLRPEHFGVAVHCRIYTQVLGLIGQGIEANPVTLKNAFTQDDALEPVGGAKYLMELAKTAVAVTKAEDDGRIIVDHWRRRELIAACEDTLDQAYQVDFQQSSADITASLENRIDELARDGSDRLAGVNPRTLEGLPVPVRRFVVIPWIPMGRATGLYGTGGIGKTTLMQMLCTSTALDPAKFREVNWLGLPVRHCRSVLLFAEDDQDEMHARQEEINRAYDCSFDDLGDMLWLPRLGKDNTLMTFENGRACRTPLFYELLRLIRAHGAQLVVWDTLTDVFGGSEIDRGQARRFVQEGAGYVAREIDGATICCAHPSLTGLKNGTGSSGSTGWDGGFRSRLYLSTPKEDAGGEAPDTDERVLKRIKGNWTTIGETIPMRWRDGLFIADRPPGGILGSIERRTAERVFLDLLDELAGQGRYVSEKSRASNYAPKRFAGYPHPERLKIPDFTRAMEKLFARREITVSTVKGVNRHPQECIVRRSER
jgi:RecA-family ATPase